MQLTCHDMTLKYSGFRFHKEDAFIIIIFILLYLNISDIEITESITTLLLHVLFCIVVLPRYWIFSCTS